MNFRKSNIAFFIISTVLFFSITQLSAGNAVSNAEKGWAYLERGSLQQALYRFKDALNENPSYSRAVHGLARTYYEAEIYNEAIDLYKKLIKIEGKSYNAYTGLGMSFTKLGNYKSAISYFEKAEKISGNDMAASYGVASLYYSMGKKIWAKRKIDSILRIDPFHFKTLLLLADAKSDEGRLEEARKYIEKAIDSNQNSPEGFVKFAEILFRDFLKNRNANSLVEAEDVIKNARSINPDHYRANLLMGYICIEKNDYNKAALFFKMAGEEIASSGVDYSIGVAFDRGGVKKSALESFLKAYQNDSSDSLVRCRLEDFLVLNNYKSGHPARVMLSRENLQIARKRMNKNLSDEIVMYLRRALLLNPLDENIRKILMSYYSALEYNRYYIAELKELLRMNPGRKYTDRLAAAIALRRNKLYNREGYSSDTPVRDVPVVLVLNYKSEKSLPRHPDAGEVIASYISLVMEQFGRMRPVTFRKRQGVCRNLGKGNFQDDLVKISDLEKKGSIPFVDYILYGEYQEEGKRIAVHSYLVDKKKGVLMSDFLLSSKDREKLPGLSLRTVKKIYNTIPYSGRVMKITDSGVIVNLGLIDGLKKGDTLVIYKYNNSSKGMMRKKILLNVQDSNTLVSLCKPKKKSSVDEIDSKDKVFPLKNRRARLIE